MQVFFFLKNFLFIHCLSTMTITYTHYGVYKQSVKAILPYFSNIVFLLLIYFCLKHTCMIEAKMYCCQRNKSLSASASGALI